MELIVRNITSIDDCRMLAALARRLAANPILVPGEEAEDALLLETIEKTRKRDYVSEAQVLATLAKIK